MKPAVPHKSLEEAPKIMTARPKPMPRSSSSSKAAEPASAAKGPTAIQEEDTSASSTKTDQPTTTTTTTPKMTTEVRQIPKEPEAKVKPDHAPETRSDHPPQGDATAISAVYAPSATESEKHQAMSREAVFGTATILPAMNLVTLSLLRSRGTSVVFRRLPSHRGRKVKPLRRHHELPMKEAQNHQRAKAVRGPKERGDPFSTRTLVPNSIKEV